MTMDNKGFSLLEIIVTIIVIAIALVAIVESFIAGSTSSINISNQQTAQNIAKQTMAELYYCRNGGTTGICSFKTTTTIWDNPGLLDSTQSTPLNNECFYTVVKASCAILSDTNGDVSITGSCPAPPPPPADYISAVVNTGWFALNSGGTCPTPPASYPSVTVSTIFANY